MQVMIIVALILFPVSFQLTSFIPRYWVKCYKCNKSRVPIKKPN